MTTPGARQSRVEKLASAKGPALLVVFLALVGLAVGVSIQRDYAQTIADAFQTLESQAILAEAKVSGVLRGLDIGLHGLAALRMNDFNCFSAWYCKKGNACRGAE